MAVESNPDVASTTPEPAPSRRVDGLIPWLVRGWPLLTAVGAIVAVQLIATSAPATYESTGSYIVRAQAPDAEGRIQATALLNGTVRIDSTFAQIAKSRRTFDRAIATLPPDEVEAARDAEVDATTTGSANILSISARTNGPSAARSLAAALGDETIAYVEGLSELYDLGVLDPPGEATMSPEGIGTRVGLAAGVAGFGVGVVTRPMMSRRYGRRIAPERRLDTGFENERYTLLRMREERARTDSTGIPFHLAVLQPDLPVQRTDITSLAALLAMVAREEDHIGYLAKSRPRTFIAILPSRTDDEVRSLVSHVQQSAVDRLSRRYGPSTRAAAHWCSYRNGAFTGDAAAIMVAEALS